MNVRLSEIVPFLPHLDYGVLLRVDEGLEDDPDGHVDVVLVHVLPQVHLGVGLRQPDHALDVPHSDGDAAIVNAFEFPAKMS